MRNKHRFKAKIECRCPKDGCGCYFTKTVTVNYATNQRGDVIESKVE